MKDIGGFLEKHFFCELIISDVANDKGINVFTTNMTAPNPCKSSSIWKRCSLNMVVSALFCFLYRHKWGVITYYIVRCISIMVSFHSLVALFSLLITIPISHEKDYSYGMCLCRAKSHTFVFISSQMEDN